MALSQPLAVQGNALAHPCEHVLSWGCLDSRDYLEILANR